MREEHPAAVVFRQVPLSLAMEYNASRETRPLLAPFARGWHLPLLAPLPATLVALSPAALSTKHTTQLAPTPRPTLPAPTPQEFSQDLLVMENCFYGRPVARIYDLKGSERNRFNADAASRPEDHLEVQGRRGGECSLHGR